MRKWAYLKHPLLYDDKRIVKIMIYETSSDGTYVFLYNARESQICVVDEWYETTAESTIAWNDHVFTDSWVIIDDPLPDCQADSILPIRVKGRDCESPEWGNYELFTNGIWIKYEENGDDSHSL